jgi:HAD superfamily hydrolase (TIGR01493 family)
MEYVLVFDAYGTLFDLESLQPRVEALCPGYGKVVTQLWRLKQLEYSWLRTLMGEPFVDFSTVTRQSLRFALASAIPRAEVRYRSIGDHRFRQRHRRHMPHSCH